MNSHLGLKCVRTHTRINSPTEPTKYPGLQDEQKEAPAQDRLFRGSKRQVIQW